MSKENFKKSGFYIRDEVTVPVTSHLEEEEVRDLLSDLADSDGESDAPKALKVRIAATHSGFVNGNGNFYTHDGMKNSTRSWTKPYPKPVLRHHDKKSEPIGRVKNAQFMDLEINDAKGGGSKPTGYISLLTYITDPDAMKKILDERYLTVSIGGTAQAIKCSICKQDIINDGICEHEKGEIYDKKKCYWEVGGVKYSEVSFVNKPADEIAGVESIEVVDSVDTCTVIESIVLDDTEHGNDVREEQEERPLKKKEKEKEDAAQKTPEDSVFTDEDVDILFGEGWISDEAEKAFLAEILETKTEDDESEVFEKKLSSKGRKKLAKSTFCGPDRSFPVPDCAHAANAKARLGNSKLSSSAKKTVLACIVRKQKSLGCEGFGKSAKGVDSDVTTDEYLGMIVSGVEHAAVLVDSLEESEAKVKKLDEKILELAEAEGDEVATEALKNLKKSNEVLQEQLDTSEARAKQLEEERDEVLEDKEVNATSLIKMNASRLVDMRIQLRKPDMADVVAADGKDKQTLRQSKIEEYMKRSLDSLVDSCNDVLAEFVEFITSPSEGVESKAVVDADNEGFTKRRGKRAGKREPRSRSDQIVKKLFGDKSN